MEFRPCIDIHNGKVKQIVGGTLSDQGNFAQENFVSGQNASFYAELYKKYNLKGGHIILLNPASSPYFEANREQALDALRTYPGGMQIGGGITAENAEEYLRAGASHVIVTSYVFRNGEIHYENLEKIRNAAGKEHLVLDVSCRKRREGYVIVTDRWQKETDVILTPHVLKDLSGFCDEFLVHAVDAEGKSEGIETDLVDMLAKCELLPITYAGGIHSIAELEKLKHRGGGRIHATIGSALELFGGPMKWEEVLEVIKD